MTVSKFLEYRNGREIQKKKKKTREKDKCNNILYYTYNMFS